MTSEPNIQASQDPTDDAPGMTRGDLLRNASVLGVAAVAGGSIGVARSVAAASTDSFATSSAAALALTPEQEEGPFYVALEKIRKNITLGRAGVPLQLKLKVVDTAGKAVENAACDIWQCDATGVYSDESSESTIGQTWLRGVQFTNAQGVAEFETIYPGHYAGRTTHIHAKVHIGGKRVGTAYRGGHVSHTGQLLFDDAITSMVYKLAPYTSDTASRVLNPEDRVYSEQGGSRIVLKLTRLGATVASGYLATITLALDPTATPAPVGVGG
jgi:protocatechuate 3,4-dioxygenase beta subunit